MKKGIVLLLIGALLILPGCSKPAPVQPSAPAQEKSDLTQLDQPTAGASIAILDTSLGIIKVKLMPEAAPKAVENFTGLAQKGYYDGLTFHRVMKDFMIQGGDPEGTGTGGESLWGKPFADEFSADAHNFRGALSMANSGPNTNGSQFFIVQLPAAAIQPDMFAPGTPQSLVDAFTQIGGTPWLDGKHTVFGQVYEGMDVLDKITEVKTGQGDKPVDPVIIKTVKVETFK